MTRRGAPSRQPPSLPLHGGTGTSCSRSCWGSWRSRRSRSAQRTCGSEWGHVVPGGQAGGDAQGRGPHPTGGAEVRQADCGVPQERLQGAGTEGGGGRHDGSRDREHEGGLASLESVTQGGGWHGHQIVLRIDRTPDRGEGGSLRLPGLAGRAHSHQQGSHPAPRPGASRRGDQVIRQDVILLTQRADGRRHNDVRGGCQGLAGAR